MFAHYIHAFLLIHFTTLLHNAMRKFGTFFLGQTSFTEIFKTGSLFIMMDSALSPLRQNNSVDPQLDKWNLESFRLNKFY